MRRDLTSAVPVPRVMALGQEQYLVSHLKIKELAILQRWLMSQVPDPIEGRLSDIFAGKVKRRELVALHEACSAWPPAPGSAESETILYTEDGLRFFLTLLLSRHQPQIQATEVAAIVSSITIHQWDALRYHAFAGDSLDILYRRIDPVGARKADELRRGGKESRPKDWPAEFARLWEKSGGSGSPREFFDSLAELELPQYVALLGRDEDEDYTPVADSGLKEERARRWACWNVFEDEEDGDEERPA